MLIGGLLRLGLGWGCQAAQVALELKTALQEVQIDEVARRPLRLDLGDQAGKLPGRESFLEGALELLFCPEGAGAGNARGRGDGGEVRSRGGCGGEAPSHREEDLVVEHDVDEIGRPVPGHRGQAPEVHEQRAVAVDDHHLQLGTAQGDPQADRRGQAHGMPEIEEAGLVSEGEQLGRRGPHDW